MFLTILDYNRGCRVMLSQALCKTSRSYTTLQLFYLMKKKGFVHSVCSYTALIYGFCREGMQDNVFQWLDFMQNNGCKPNVITYMIIVKFLFDNGKFEEAMNFVSKMERERCNPDLLPYNVILRELFHRDRLDDISELIQGFQPDEVTLRILSQAVSNGSMKRFPKVAKVLDWVIMEREKSLLSGASIFFPSRASHAKHLKCRIFEKNPTKIKNYGIWLRYQSRTGYHNMYKKYRDTTLKGVVEQKYTEIASRHRVRFLCI
ncbi:hypothetical protein PVK06_030827 [Gossypium arboreum]|uniref:Large ribosomal subunit protein eL20 domain-containing protein n=1 Tax=Gossypium arboreum TaxID=29729 RepID=A0ABR0NQD1_GOSAR|nr:hypothetical protein PVK06_030827 [Gossypium arboreum]